MQIAFTKMHGLGNDFVVFDAVNHPLSLTPEQVQFIAHRHFGVGCDQILLAETSNSPEVDFRYRIFNADGGEVQQCGNGARCLARFVRDKGLSDKETLVVETGARKITLRILDDSNITVDIGIPIFKPASIPFQAEKESVQYPIMVDTKVYQIGAVSVGNPHAILVVDDLSIAPVDTIGPSLEAHSRFPEHTNVGFMQIIDSQNIRLRTYERGVGETLACGSGACAAVVVGQKLGKLDKTVTVKLAGGRLTVHWEGGAQNPVQVTGAATRVFEGTIDI